MVALLHLSILADYANSDAKGNDFGGNRRDGHANNSVLE
jgi:hypothetical protein